VVISSLRTASFRNLTDSLVITNVENIFLIGENGQGKTNFLEALYFCSYASSFRGSHDSEIIQNGKKNFSAAITTVEQSISTNVLNEIFVKFDKGKKTFFIDGKQAEDRKELLSLVPCIIFCHDDIEFVAGSPERRRWFFDQVLSLYDPVYLDDLRSYRKVLKSRNSILRDNIHRTLNGNPEAMLDTLDQQCALYGIKIMEKRETASQLFSKIFSVLFEEVSGFVGMTVQFRPSWKVTTMDEIVDLLQKRRAADIAVGTSLSGPHRDRYDFVLDGVEYAGKASTGQRRLLALLLRVAQAHRYHETTGINPILLLDDVLLEMDGEKRRRFLSALPNYAQAFFTFLPEEPYHLYQKDNALVYYVKNGAVTTVP
jgi:DNA replication and repair protein RecF